MTLPSQTPVVVTRIQNRRGTQTQFEALYPAGYAGVGGYGDPNFPGFDESNYPNVLLAGEIALITDSRRVFVGNTNGEYLELQSSSSDSNIEILPLTIPLVNTAGNYVVIPQLDISATPFLQILYSVSDSGSTDPNAIGADFSASGTMMVTSIANSAGLTNNMTEINVNGGLLTFIAVYESGNIRIKYKHDFPTTLYLSVGTIRWISI